jgi:hypothetical protein
VVASPHSTEAAVKPKTAAVSVLFRPKKFASHPVIGRQMTFARI